MGEDQLCSVTTIRPPQAEPIRQHSKFTVFPKAEGEIKVQQSQKLGCLIAQKFNLGG
jgi:hypothetical protein